MKKYSVLNAFIMVALVFVFARNMINSAKADDLFGGESFFSETETKSDTNFLWESDGSLTTVTGAKDSGYVIKDGEIETFVIPSDTGNTFINDGSTGELIICNAAIGCY